MSVTLSLNISVLVCVRPFVRLSVCPYPIVPQKPHAASIWYLVHWKHVFRGWCTSFRNFRKIQDGRLMADFVIFQRQNMLYRLYYGFNVFLMYHQHIGNQVWRFQWHAQIWPWPWNEGHSRSNLGKCVIFPLLCLLCVWDVLPTHRKSGMVIPMACSNLTLTLKWRSFKVKYKKMCYISFIMPSMCLGCITNI